MCIDLRKPSKDVFTLSLIIESQCTRMTSIILISRSLFFFGGGGGVTPHGRTPNHIFRMEIFFEDTSLGNRELTFTRGIQFANYKFLRYNRQSKQDDIYAQNGKGISIIITFCHPVFERI